MSLNRPLDPLRLNADVSLRHSGGAVLQKALHKGIIKAVVLVNLRRVPFAEAVGADALIAQVFADDGKLLLDRPFRIESIFNVERVDNASDSIYDIFHDLGNMRSLLPTSMWNNKNLYDAALDKLFSAIIEAGIINYNIACESDSTLTATNYLKRERNYYGILKNHWSSSLKREIQGTFA